MKLREHEQTFFLIVGLPNILLSHGATYIPQKNVINNLSQIRFNNEIFAAVFKRTKIYRQNYLNK